MFVQFNLFLTTNYFVRNGQNIYITRCTCKTHLKVYAPTSQCWFLHDDDRLNRLYKNAFLIAFAAGLSIDSCFLLFFFVFCCAGELLRNFVLICMNVDSVHWFTLSRTSLLTIDCYWGHVYVFWFIIYLRLIYQFNYRTLCTCPLLLMIH